MRPLQISRTNYLVVNFIFSNFIFAIFVLYDRLLHRYWRYIPLLSFQIISSCRAIASKSVRKQLMGYLWI